VGSTIVLLGKSQGVQWCPGTDGTVAKKLLDLRSSMLEER